MDTMIHIANLFLLLSLSLKDVLWLRALNVVASVCFILYFQAQHPPMLAPIAWNVLFMGVNFYQIALLWMERRPVHFDERELRIYQTVFRTLSPREFLKLLRLAQWKEAPTGHTLVQAGAELPEVMLLISGDVHVTVDGKDIGTLGEGQFVGEMSFLTQDKASADVRVLQPVEYIAWPKDSLRQCMDENPLICSSIQLILGNDLVKKLRSH